MDSTVIPTLASVGLNILVVIVVWLIKGQVADVISPVINAVNTLTAELKVMKSTLQTHSTAFDTHTTQEFPHPQMEDRLAQKFITRNELHYIIGKKNGDQSRANSES